MRSRPTSDGDVEEVIVCEPTVSFGTPTVEQAWRD
jgi:hypothetical protein